MMTPAETLDKRQALINSVFTAYGRTENAVHIIAENWSGEENKRLIKENKEQQEEINKLKNIKR